MESLFKKYSERIDQAKQDLNNQFKSSATSILEEKSKEEVQEFLGSLKSNIDLFQTAVNAKVQKLGTKTTKNISYEPEELDTCLESLDGSSDDELDGHLASKRKLLERARNNWAEFQNRRMQYLAQMHLRDGGSEKITENILVDLFTLVLDWPLANMDYQSGWCDIVLVDAGVKHLLIEAKYPGKFSSTRAMEQALSQVSGYSLRHKVYRVAVSDGNRLYALDLLEGKICVRIDVKLDEGFSEELWFVSRHGIYRSIEGRREPKSSSILSGEVFHSKYKLPSQCFAYVGSPLDSATWSLPYLHSDGSVDEKRLPKAISAIVSNYRGAKVGKIPDRHIHDVLRRLGEAARHLGKMPDQNSKTAETYHKLSQALSQSKK